MCADSGQALIRARIDAQETQSFGPIIALLLRALLVLVDSPARWWQLTSSRSESFMLNISPVVVFSHLRLGLRVPVAGTKWGRRVYLDMSRLREEEQTAAEMPVA